MKTVKKTTNSENKLINKNDLDNPYTSIEYRLKRLKKDEKQVLTDLYCAVMDAIDFRNLNIESIAMLENVSIDEKNKLINYELDVINSYDIFEDLLPLVIGPKYLEKAGLLVKRKPEDDDIKNIIG